MDLCTIINPSSVIVLVGRTNVTNLVDDGIENAKGFEICFADGDYLGHHNVCSSDCINSGFYWTRNRLDNGHLRLRDFNVLDNSLNVLGLVWNLMKTISIHWCDIQCSRTLGVTTRNPASSCPDVTQESVPAIGPWGTLA